MASGVMDVISSVSTALQTKWRPLMTTKPAIDTKTCVGSERFGIETHEARVDDFPKQPSQKDGLGRMCRDHWKAYTAGLRKDARARKASEA
jgi:hypothetical protein